MRSFVLQPWTTIQCVATSFTQDEETWLDLGDFADAAFWIDVSQLTQPMASVITLVLETSPSRDESTFQPLAAPITLATSATPTLIKSVRSGLTAPLSRYVRWRLSAPGASGGWSATFRVRGSAGRSSFFVPPQISGCVLWLRADLGVTASGTAVSTWADSSGTGDTNKNVTQATGTAQPTLQAANTSYNSQPTINFNGTSDYMLSGTWTNPVSQPSSWLLVGHRSSITANAQYFMDGDTTGFGLAVLGSATPNSSITATTGTSLTSGNGNPWTSASCVLVEENTTNSNLYINSFSSTIATGPIGTNGVNSMTLGAHSAFFGGGNEWGGVMAEIIAFNRLLTLNEKSMLRSYMFGRYALSIG